MKIKNMFDVSENFLYVLEKHYEDILYPHALINNTNNCNILGKMITG